MIVGVGQFTERIDDPRYRGMSAVDLATAAKAALADTGADARHVADAVDTVVGVRQFEISGPTRAPLGKSNNYPRSVMKRLGATFDLYGCFPFPVFVICEALGIDGDDPRGLTLTGGLPYFGGPGNSYSLHGIAETVNEMRDSPGRFGFVGANGGIMSKYSVGIYSTTPVDWKKDRSEQLCKEITQLPKVPVTKIADGSATVETYSVRYDWPVRTAIIVGRLDDDSRFLAMSEDEDLVALCSDDDPIGARITVRSTEHGNRVSLA